MPRIRTVDKGYDEYKESIDPNTCLSRHDWRQIVITGKLKSLRRSGKRYLYDLNEMISYLKNPNEEQKDQDSTYGKLRKL